VFILAGEKNSYGSRPLVKLKLRGGVWRMIRTYILPAIDSQEDSVSGMGSTGDLTATSLSLSESSSLNKSATSLSILAMSSLEKVNKGLIVSLKRPLSVRLLMAAAVTVDSCGPLGCCGLPQCAGGWRLVTTPRAVSKRKGIA